MSWGKVAALTSGLAYLAILFSVPFGPEEGLLAMHQEVGTLLTSQLVYPVDKNPKCSGECECECAKFSVPESGDKAPA